MKNVGLSYLTLERRASTLSGGEAQRIRLATQIGSSLVGVLYILDEPTIGLHQRDNALLIDTLKHLRDIGNTLIVVEHDEQTLRTADYIVDLGPGAGVHGGHVVAAGTLEEVCANPRSLTGQYLSGALTIERRRQRAGRATGSPSSLRGARSTTSRASTSPFPSARSSPSRESRVPGSRRSSPTSCIPALSNRVGGTRLPEGAYASLEGAEEIDKVINIDQSPIGRTPRSNPATYVGLFGPIRTLFSPASGGQGQGIQGRAVLLQRRGRPLREVPGRGHHPHRDALPARRLRHLRRRARAAATTARPSRSATRARTSTRSWR